MRQLMDFIYEELSKFAPTFHEEMAREPDGSIIINSIKIVYNLDSWLASDNKVKRELPLTVDVWFPRDDLFEAISVIEAIEECLKDRVERFNSGSVLRIAKGSTFLLNIKDPDLNIRRRRLNFDINYYK